MNDSGLPAEVPFVPPRPLRVLVVDDSDCFRQALVCCLNSYHGLSIVGEAANGREGFALAARLQPDLVITDFDMPKMDRLQLVDLLRREYPQMRSLLVSCHDISTLHAAGQQHGADAFIPKEHLFAELPRLLARLFPEPTPQGAVAALCSGPLHWQSSPFTHRHRWPGKAGAHPPTRSATVPFDPLKSKQ